MATKPDAGKTEAADSAKGGRNGNKLVIIGGIVVLIFVLAGGGAWFFLSKNRAAGSDTPKHVVSKGPPTFLPLDNMVVNLADPGGERVAQVGITLELVDAKAVDRVKVYLPAIRSGVLLLISQRTAEELLLIEGKEQLAADILLEASRPFGGGDVEPEPPKSSKDGVKTKKKRVEKDTHDESPVRDVLFSSFIVQ